MQQFAKFIPPVFWVVAAAVVFPLFAPTAYNALLFGGRLAAAVVCLGLAFVAFRMRAQWLVPQLVASVVAIGAANYVSGERFKLITPSEAHMLALVHEGLEKQGPQAVEEYTDLTVSGSKCHDANGDWDCTFNLSYKVASTGKTFQNEPQSIRYSQRSGKVFGMTACELDFQWSQRFRASSYYAPGLEPVSWSECRVNDDNTAYLRSLSVKSGLGFLIAKGDTAATLTLAPMNLWDAQILVKDAYKGANVECAHAPGNTPEVRCKVQGDKVVWEGSVVSAGSPLGGSTQLKSGFTETVSIVPQGNRWTVKK